MTIPYVLPELTKLGEVYRGDTVVLPVWEARDRFDQILDLTGSTIWFTAKEKLTDLDGAPPGFQVSTLTGSVVVLDPLLGTYQVTIPSTATTALASSVAMLWDVQVRDVLAVVTTVKRGTISFIADVTLSQV